MEVEKSGVAVPTTRHAGIEVQLRSDRLELRFTRRFTPADLAAVKAIRDRTWVQATGPTGRPGDVAAERWQ